MFLSQVDSSNIHPVNGGGDDQLIPLAKQVCGLYQSQWDDVGTPHIYMNAMGLVQGNSPRLSNTDAGMFVYIAQVAYCPRSEHG